MTQRIAHYELLNRIAEGGMGIVYQARDTRLDRLVALKFLSPDLEAGDEELAQFLHEARAISRLNHPNIATIYAVEEDEGDRFLAFEFLPGGTLRDAAAQSGGGLRLEKVFKWAIHVGRALAHAHRHGIIHRDVKSANVLLTDEGDVKLTDFGLAQVTGAVEGAFETAGTVAYMAPEHAQGGPIDALSDQYSFGVVVFELATGRTPFHADTQAEILYDAVHTAAPRLRSQRAHAPQDLDDAVNQMLAKNPADRYPSMEEAVAALVAASERARVERTQSIPAYRPPKQPAVAVLPLVDMSPQRDQEVFCDGIAEEMLGALSAIEGLKVVSRGSSFQFKGQPYDVREIGRKLGVETVLEGSVRKSGDKLRIAVQHVDVSTGQHLWAERFDRDLGDVFAIQDEIAMAVAENFRLRLAHPDRSARTAPNLEAYDLYLAGRFHLNQRRKEALDRALEAFQGANSLDPSFAPAAAGLAETHILLAAGIHEGVEPRAAMEQARKWAQRAVELDPNRAEGYVPLAQVALRADWDWESAERGFRRAVELNPNYATGRHQYAMFLAFCNRLDEAREQIALAHELDPLSPIISTAVGRILHFSRDYEGAIAQFRKTLELDPVFAQALFDLLVAYGVTGRRAEAEEAIEQIARIAPEPGRMTFIRSRFSALNGDLEASRAELAKIEKMFRDPPVSPVLYAILYMGLGEIERAMTLLFEAVEQRDALLVYLQCEPTYDPLRSHPRYRELIGRIGFPALAVKSLDSADRIPDNG